MSFLSVIVVGFLWAQSILTGPTLRLSAVTGAPGELVEAEILLASPSGKEPLGLQWNILLPSSQLSLEDGIRLGPAAKDAGKSLRCSDKKTEGGTRTLICILSGGQKPIQNGAIALLKLRIPPAAKPGTAKVRIEHSLAVSKDLKGISVQVAEGDVVIRQK